MAAGGAIFGLIIDVIVYGIVWYIVVISRWPGDTPLVAAGPTGGYGNPPGGYGSPRHLRLPQRLTGEPASSEHRRQETVEWRHRGRRRSDRRPHRPVPSVVRLHLLERRHSGDDLGGSGSVGGLNYWTGWFFFLAVLVGLALIILRTFAPTVAIPALPINDAVTYMVVGGVMVVMALLWLGPRRPSVVFRQAGFSAGVSFGLFIGLIAGDCRRWPEDSSSALIRNPPPSRSALISRNRFRRPRLHPPPPPPERA